MRGYSPAQRFVLERLDLLLGRLEELGRQVRDTIARIVGSTVAESVADLMRKAVRCLPGHQDRYRDYDEEYDPYGYDPYGNENPRHHYRQTDVPSFDWHEAMHV